MFLLDLWLIRAFLFFIIFLLGEQAGGGFAGFILAVLVHLGLGGISGAAGFLAAGWG